MANSQRCSSSIAIERKANGRLVPSINGRRWNKLEAVAECLFDNLGRGVPYKRLLGVIGRNSDNPTSQHLLRQYISTLREMLLGSNSPYHIAVIKEAGPSLAVISGPEPHPGVSKTGRKAWARA
jgi:hypothetical protein